MEEKKKEWFDPKNMGDDFLNFMKSSFDATFDNVVKIQDLNEKMLKDLLDKGKEGQDEAGKMVNDFIDNAKKGRDEYKKVMEDGFKKVEDMLKTEK